MNVADLAFTSVLALSAILAALLVGRAQPDARRYLRFAAALYCAVALADLASIVDTAPALQSFATSVSWLVMALAPASLALSIAAAFQGRPSDSIAIATLLFACASGITAAVSGAVFIALAALFASACAILTLAIRRLRNDKAASPEAFVAALALLASAAANVTAGPQARTSLALFSAASLLGTALASVKQSRLAVEKPAAHPANVIALIRRDR